MFDYSPQPFLAEEKEKSFQERLVERAKINEDEIKNLEHAQALIKEATGILETIKYQKLNLSRKLAMKIEKYEYDHREI